MESRTMSSDSRHKNTTTSKSHDFFFFLLLNLKPIFLILVTATVVSTLIFFSSKDTTNSSSRSKGGGGNSLTRPFMANASTRRSFILWLHGLGDNGPANQPIKNFFTSSPAFSGTGWAFPTAPTSPVSCNRGALMPSWFDIYEMPISSVSPKDEEGLTKAIQNVHDLIDKELATGTRPENVFVCGFSQGGALTLASVLQYPRTLGGGAIFSGWVPFNSSTVVHVSQEAKKTPILWCHGMADYTVLFEAGQAGPLFLQQAGVPNCEFKAYPALGHSITGEELELLQSWILTRLQAST